MVGSSKTSRKRIAAPNYYNPNVQSMINSLFRRSQAASHQQDQVQVDQYNAVPNEQRPTANEDMQGDQATPMSSGSPVCDQTMAGPSSQAPHVNGTDIPISISSFHCFPEHKTEVIPNSSPSTPLHGIGSSMPTNFGQMQVDASGADPSSLSPMDTATHEELAQSSSVCALPQKRRSSSINSSVSFGQDEAFAKVCEYVRDDDVGIIGIHGMGGVGKTTLLRKVCYEFLKPSGFSVIWTTVSKNVDFSNIQKSIMRELNVSFREHHDPQASGMKINETLINSKDKVALLLDDIWEAIDFEQLGVAGGERLDTSKFKIIFTTRSEDVCLQMDPDQKMKIECLGPEESWALFKRSAGEEVLSSHDRITGVAKEVAKECRGLPLALTVIGKAMVCKTSFGAWEDALKTLRNCPSLFSGAEKNLYERLKFSYDNLENQVERDCFLFCCMYPEDREIDKDALVESWIGEGLLDIGYGTYQETCNRGHDIIDTLLAKSLLEAMKSKYSSSMIVKMHDVIRDMGLWIGSESNFFVYTHCLELSGEEITKRWNRARHVYIEDLYTDIPQELDCPNLSSLHICGMGRRIKRSNTFLNSMNFMLKVKILIINSVWFTCSEIPTSTIGLLVELRHLEIIESNMVALPQDMGNLTKLLALILLGNHNLSTLPPTIGGLCELRKLQISRCNQVRNLPSELGKLKRLEMVEISTLVALSIGNIFSYCPELRRLHLDIQDPTMLSDDLLYNLKKLEELRIKIGGRPEKGTFWIEGVKRSTSLKVLTVDGLPIADGDEVIFAIGAMRLLCELRITRCDIYTLMIPAATDFLPQLKVLEIRKCRLLEKVHFSNRTLQSLCVLEIGRCDRLMQVVGHYLLFDDVQTSVCFPNLQRLHLRSLWNIKRICNDKISFPSLSKFTLYDCPMLEKLPRGLMNENRTSLISGKIVGTEEWWEGLEWEDDAFKSYLRPLFVESNFFRNILR